MKDKLAWQSLGIDQIADLYLESALGLIAELTPEQIAKIKDLTPVQFTELTSEQLIEYGIRKSMASALSLDKVNFQLFTSGLGVRYTFLLHIHTGRTWQLANDPETDTLFWLSMD
ncbi:MAG: hypothetical protein M3R25_04515 [Bacteroidota bacterium]|nr:hypothetical protein [Bacteroidota bacterium]